MLRACFSKPASGLEQFVRFYVQREARIHDGAVVHPVPARATPMIVFEFADPPHVLTRNARTPRKSPAAVVVGPQTSRLGKCISRGSSKRLQSCFSQMACTVSFQFPCTNSQTGAMKLSRFWVPLFRIFE